MPAGDFLRCRRRYRVLGVAGLPRDSPKEHAPRRSMIERSAVVPAFEKRQLQIFRGRTVYFELHVVPGWARSVTEVELDDLLIAAVALIVVTAVAQVDATDEGGISTARATECDQLLVMASRALHPFIEENGPAGIVHLLREIAVLLFAEVDSVHM